MKQNKQPQLAEHPTNPQEALEKYTPGSEIERVATHFIQEWSHKQPSRHWNILEVGGVPFRYGADNNNRSMPLLHLAADNTHNIHCVSADCRDLYQDLSSIASQLSNFQHLQIAIGESSSKENIQQVFNGFPDIVISVSSIFDDSLHLADHRGLDPREILGKAYRRTRDGGIDEQDHATMNIVQSMRTGSILLVDNRGSQPYIPQEVQHLLQPLQIQLPYGIFAYQKI